MGRSVFILNSPKPGAEKIQFRKLRDEFKSKRLGISGPFGDSGNALAELTQHVEKQMEAMDGGSPLNATIAALAPQNTWAVGSSLLPVPFVLSDSYSDHSIIRDCAGAIASTLPVVKEDTMFREISHDHLELLTVAVLRRFGVDCHYAFMHPDQSSPLIRVFDSLRAALGQASIAPLPCVLVMGETPEVYTMKAPFIPLALSHASGLALEVLDDNAALSLLKMDVAITSCESLMRDVAMRAPSVDGELHIRAIATGHALHTAMLLWTPEEARQGLLDSASLLNMETPEDMFSVRDRLERTAVHKLVCSECHETAATYVMSRAVLLDVLKDTVKSGEQYMLSAEQANAILAQTDFSEKLQTYMSLAATMNQHVHPASECKSGFVTN
jgi:hypothetical protein